MFKKSIAVLIAAMLLAAFPVSFCFADETESAAEPGIQPMIIGVVSVMPRIIFNGNIAQCDIIMPVDVSKIDKAKMTVKLQKKSGNGYTTVKTWRDQEIGVDALNRIVFQKSYAVSSHGTYKLYVDGKVYKGSKQVDAFIVESAERVY